MTERLKEMIFDYKNKGERVDEVLFQEVTKEIERMPELEKSQQAWEETARNYVDENLSLKAENKRFREALSFYAQYDNWWTYPVPGGYASAATVDNGRRARKELEESK